MEKIMNKIVGALCSDDYKGINSQYVDQGKVVVCLKNTSSATGERSMSQDHCGRIKEHMGGGVGKHRGRQTICG